MTTDRPNTPPTDEKPIELSRIVRSMVDASVDATAVVGPNLELLHFNRSYLKLSGLRPRQLRNRRVSNMCHEHFGLETCADGCISRRAMESGRSLRFDEVTTHDKSLRLIVVAIPLFDKEGNVFAVIEQYRDVTAESRMQTDYRRLLEEERADKRRQAAEAARKLEQRNQELHEANTKLQRANSAKSQFLASMSHEIRTPLSGVLGMARLLESTPLSQVQHHFVKTICQSGDTLLALINNILDFSKIEAGKMELESIAFSVRSVVEGASYIFAPTAQQKGLEFIVMIDPAVPDTCLGDPGRLQQILVNLCNNAVKFTEKGHVLVAVTPHPTRENWLDFAVADSGIGIPEDRRARLFQAFSQVDGSTTRKFGGTGLGLAITRKLTGLMGGDIVVESEVGVGTTFRVSLAVEPVPGMHADFNLAHADTIRADVIDDNPLRRKSLADTLRWLGVAVHEHEHVRDVMLHGDQADLRQRVAFVCYPVPADENHDLEALMHHPAIRCYAVAKVTDYADLPRHSGMAGFVTRPTKPSQIASTLRAIIEPHRRRPAAVAVSDDTDLLGLRNGQSILVVEDNPINQEILSRFLKRAGYKVESVNNGREAIGATQSTPYDLVLMDCQMPIMDGFEATKAIRAQERLSGGHLPIIAMTANATTEDREHCYRAGMDGYMTKPFQPDSLIQRLDAMLLGTPA